MADVDGMGYSGPNNNNSSDSSSNESKPFNLKSFLKVYVSLLLIIFSLFLFLSPLAWLCTDKPLNLLINVYITLAFWFVVIPVIGIIVRVRSEAKSNLSSADYSNGGESCGTGESYGGSCECGCDGCGCSGGGSGEMGGGG